MGDILLRGEFLRGSRGFTFGDSTGVTWTFDSTTNKLTLAITAGAVGSFDEAVDDRVALLLQNGTGISWVYNDGANTLTPAVSLAAFTTTNLAEGANLYFTDERAQDAVGTILTDSTSIDFTYNDGANTITAAVIPGNPTASVGLTAVNGTAATPMRSDAAPALDQGIVPTWTQTHTFSNATAFKFGTSGTELDFGVYNDVVASSNAGRIFTTDGTVGGIKSGAAGHIVIQPRSSATRSVIIATSSGSGTPANRFEIDATALTLTVPVYAPATVAGAASLRLPHGTAPSSPVNGDMWTTTAGLYVRINGTTVGPLS